MRIAWCARSGTMNRQTADRVKGRARMINGVAHHWMRVRGEGDHAENVQTRRFVCAAALRLGSLGIVPKT